jgi:Zn-dependent protease
VNGSNQRKSGSWKSLGGILAFFALVGGKLKFLLPLLKLGKIGGTIWSMFVMVAAYAFFYPWTFAIGIVVMIFIHEMGHVIAARQKKLPVSAPAFIPFLGALITMKRQPVDAATEAYIAMGGPLLGTVGAVACLGLAVALDSPALAAVAQLGFFLNLINLIPVHPLDGGRIVTAISRWLWVIGLVGGLVVVIYLRSILFFIFWGFFAWELYKKYVRKESRKKAISESMAIIAVPEAHFTNYGLPIPAELHQRALPFVQMCDLDTKEEFCELAYPGLGRIARIPFHRGLVEHIQLEGTKAEEQVVKMKLRFTYEIYPEFLSAMKQSEEYYQVGARTRLIYGFSYVGLAVFLGWMMTLTHSLFALQPLFG